MPHQCVRESGLTKLVLLPSNSYHIPAQIVSPLEGGRFKDEFEGQSQDTCADCEKGAGRGPQRVSVERARLKCNKCTVVSICAHVR